MFFFFLCGITRKYDDCKPHRYCETDRLPSNTFTVSHNVLGNQFDGSKHVQRLEFLEHEWLPTVRGIPPTTYGIPLLNVIGNLGVGSVGARQKSIKDFLFLPARKKCLPAMFGDTTSNKEHRFTVLSCLATTILIPNHQKA